MKSHFLICLLLLLHFGTASAQVVDSIIVRTNRNTPAGSSMKYTTMEVDSFSAGLKIGSSAWRWKNNIWNAEGRSHYDYDVQNRLITTTDESFIQNAWVLLVMRMYSYNSSDSLIQTTSQNSTGTGRLIRNFSGPLLDEEINESFINGSWERTNYKTYDYDINGYRILSTEYRQNGLLWVPTYFIESDHGPGNQWSADTSFTVYVQKYYTEYELIMRDQLGRDTARYWHQYSNLNPDPWSTGFRYFNTYDWLGRFIIENGRTQLNTFGPDFLSGTSYSYDSIQHRTNFYDLTQDIYQNYGYIQYQNDGTTPVLETRSDGGPDGFDHYYTDYFYFTAGANQIILPPSITKCSADSLLMPIILNPMNTFTNFLWVPDSGLSSDTIPVPMISSNVDRTYTLYFTDINGISDTAVISVNNRTTSLDSIIVTNIDTASSCQIVELSANPTNNQYQWEINGNILSGNEDLTVDSNGTYVLLTLNDNGCINRDSITINYLPGNNSPAIFVECPGILSTTYASATYKWYAHTYLDQSFSAPALIATTTVDSLVLTPFQALNFNFYYVVCTDLNGCSRSSNRIFFRNEDTPQRSATVTCQGSCDATAIINYNYLYKNYPYTYHFQTGDSCVINSISDRYTLDSLCAGQVIYTVENGSGCIVTDTLIVNPPTTINYSTFAKTDVTSIDSCNGQIEVIPINFAQGDLIYACLDDTNCLYFVADSGYTFTNVCFGLHQLDTYDGSCAERSSILIDTLQCGLSHTSVGTSCIGCNNGVVYFNHSGTPPSTISIVPIAGIISNDSISGLPPGIYNICLTYSTGCNICFTDTLLEDPTGIRESESGNISIYPNPTSGKIMVSINSKYTDRNYILDLISSTGEILRSEKIVTGVNNLNYSDLSNGIYFLQIEMNDVIVRRKIVLLK